MVTRLVRKSVLITLKDFTPLRLTALLLPPSLSMELVFQILLTTQMITCTTSSSQSSCLLKFSHYRAQDSHQHFNRFFYHYTDGPTFGVHGHRNTLLPYDCKTTESEKKTLQWHPVTLKNGRGLQFQMAVAISLHYA